MITIFGSTNLDQIGTVTRLPQPGETVAGGTFSMAPGGKGANQALAARRAGAEVLHVSAVGDDAFAALATRLLDEGGVDLSQLRRAEAATGIAMIFVDEQGENVIAILPGANGTLSAADAETGLKNLGADDILLVQQEVPQTATRRALEIARERGARSVLNTAPYLADTAELAPLADIVIANETEFSLLSGRPIAELDAAMADWVRQTGRTIVVTLGPDGARAVTPDGALAVPAHKVEPVDTVGAGDTFCGYLAAALDAGLGLEQALRRAATAGSLACLKPGAQPAIPTKAEVDAVLKA
ncbi:ribokinase [Devosia sp. YIM 151766]|uniref:ribokinase n=1 Tax=Devosia sp. YIM 151766 TaxID=3017325 RepID=UPI00255CF625|nr:ribokinase [Devosia sp. YIM 151766]WIY52952.1 ribokinase [Devosia sp. YIM 151766]